MNRPSRSFDLSDILSKCHARGGTDGQWYGTCPAHDDRSGSLSIKKGDGKILFHCHAGCDYKAVVKALGISQDNLTPLKAKPKQVAAYEYHDENGSLLFTKLRYHPKTFRTKAADGSWSLKNVEPELYRLPELLAAVKNHVTILLCEGEKDVDAAKQLEPYGFFATTNYEGALGWKQRYNRSLKGADLVFVEDNDAAGRERTEKLSRSLAGTAAHLRRVAFPELPEKGDLHDFIAKYGVTATLARLNEASGIAPTVEAPTPWRDAFDDEKATAEDYIHFALSLPGITALERCALSGELMAKTEGQWKPTANLLTYIQGHARDFGKFFTLSAFEDQLERYRMDKAMPKLLVDLPEWDGVDRIKQQAESFRFKNLTAYDFHQLALHWGTGIFRRLKDPTLQPVTPILQGPQGVGKDSLIQSWTAALEHYARDLIIDTHNSAETLKQLHTALVFNIPEFDRTAKTDIAALKHILSTPFTDIRLPYDKTAEKRYVRASFIATCNISDILIDHTGNRRFFIWECEYLGLGDATPYPGCWRSPSRDVERKQIVAQFRSLAEAGWKVDQAAYDRCAAYTDSLTPEDPVISMLEQWDSAVEKLSCPPAGYGIDDAPLYRVVDVSEILTALCREYQRSRQKVISLLGLHGRRERKKEARLYRAGLRAKNPDELIF